MVDFNVLYGFRMDSGFQLQFQCECQFLAHGSRVYVGFFLDFDI